LLLLEAIFWLGATRILIRLIPFRRIAPHLGEHQTPEKGITPIIPGERDQLAARIGWAVNAAAPRTPWESLCLAQAITAKKMLQRRGRKSTLFLGVAKEANTELAAHAWLQCGQGIITGNAGHQRFVVISAFTDK
jgi:hypothetical protein